MNAAITRLVNDLELKTQGTISTESVDNGILRISTENHIIQVYEKHIVDRKSYGDSSKTIIHVDLETILYHYDKFVNRVLVLLGFGNKIYARKTVAARIDKRVTLAFQEEHHLQRPLPGKYRYGLFYNGELVSVAVFSGGRRMNNRPDDYRSFELLRFCQKSQFIVIGGLSKLLLQFARDFNPGDIMTYVDKDWSQNSSLKTIGFETEKTIGPIDYLINDQGDYIPKTTKENADSDEHYYLKRNSGSIKMVLTFGTNH